MSFPRTTLLVLGLLQALTGAALAGQLSSGVAIRLDDELGLPRQNELAALSVPLGFADNVTQTTQLVLLDEKGQEVPVQWKVLTRWGATPNNTQARIKFALARFIFSLAPNQTKTYTLRLRLAQHGAPDVPNVKVSWRLLGDWVEVSTGTSLFYVTPKLFNLFQAVFTDLDGNGQVTVNEAVIGPASSIGPALVDNFNGVYAGVVDPAAKWTIEEAGPLYLVLRIDGRHLPVGQNSIGRDFFTYTTRMHFVLGSNTVFVQHALNNSYLDNPLGAMSFARYLLHLRIVGHTSVAAAASREAASSTWTNLSVSSGREAVLYQDSSGGHSWNQPGTQFSGFRTWNTWQSGIRPEALPSGSPAASGGRAEGWMDLRGSGRALQVTLRYPFQNYPYALRGSSDGSLVVDLWPAEFKGLHWLDDGQRKTHEMYFTFHNPVGHDPRVAAYQLQNPVRPVVPISYLRETQAWGDFGDIRDPGVSQEQMRDTGDQQIAESYDTWEGLGNFGWENFGEPVWAKNTHTTGSPRNRLTWFDRYMTSGGAGSWWELAEVFALHSMDLRTYHLDGFEAQQQPLTELKEGMPPPGGTGSLGRGSISPALAPHKAGIPAMGHGWNGYDSEHFMVDDLYEYYLLTGSLNALDALSKIGEGIETWKILDPNKDVHSSRAIGWTMRAIMKIYAVDGDPNLLQQAHDLIASVEKFRGKTKSPKTGIVYHYLGRQIYGGSTHNMTQPYDLPWQMCVGLHGIALYGRDTGNTAVTNKIIAEVSDYIVDYCIGPGGVIVDSLECDNHNVKNPKSENDGVNTWITSALALAYRVTHRQDTIALANYLWTQQKTGWFDSGDYYHWYHTAADVLGKP